MRKLIFAACLLPLMAVASCTPPTSPSFSCTPGDAQRDTEFDYSKPMPVHKNAAGYYIC